MPTVDDQRQVFDFFRERLESQHSFTKEDLRLVTTWSPSSLDTYWSKQFRPFVTNAGNGRFRVSEAFRPFATWERFRHHVSQVRRVSANDYRRFEHDSVLIYEFFMPLTNEAALRGTLDVLFYRDTILSKLRAVDDEELNAQMPKNEAESHDDYLDRVCEWVSKRFVGYSISHVSGRFRREQLATHAQAAEIGKWSRYLIDETTAVTRFIFPCDDDDDAERVRWFFNALFVESIIEVVNGEDEIWMVESGMRNRLHIWRIEATEQPAGG